MACQYVSLRPLTLGLTILCILSGVVFSGMFSLKYIYEHLHSTMKDTVEEKVMHQMHTLQGVIHQRNVLHTYLALDLQQQFGCDPVPPSVIQHIFHLVANGTLDELLVMTGLLQGVIQGDGYGRFNGRLFRHHMNSTYFGRRSTNAAGEAGNIFHGRPGPIESTAMVRGARQVLPVQRVQCTNHTVDSHPTKINIRSFCYMPLLDNFGRVCSAVVSLHISSSLLEGQIFSAWKGSGAFVVNSAQRVLASTFGPLRHPDTRIWLKATDPLYSVQHLAAQYQLASPFVGWQEVELGHTTYLMFRKCFAPMQEEWCVCFVIPKSTILADYYQLQRQLILVSAVGVGLCIMLVFSAFTLFVHRPLRHVLSIIADISMTTNYREMASTISKHWLFEISSITEGIAWMLGGLASQAEARAVADGVRDQFIARTNHEFRTPLNGIAAMLDLLQATTLTEEQQQLVSTMQSCCTTLIRLVTDISDLGKSQAGNFTCHTKPFNLQDCVDSLVLVAAKEAHRRDISLHVEVADDIPTHLEGDSVRLTQVVSNILNNAFKFSPANSEVICGIYRKPVEPSIGSSSESCLLEFVVQDHGIGIAQDAQTKLFTPFYQVNTTNCQVDGGSGLGLCISRHIIEAMQGTITLSSTEAEGTEVRICVPLTVTNAFPKLVQPHSLPRLCAPSSSTSQPPETQPCRHQSLSQFPFAAAPTILVVDDNSVNLQVMRLLLNAVCKCNVQEASGGVDALKCITQQTPICVFLDVHMPAMDGPIACRHLHLYWDALGITAPPVVGVTADTSVEVSSSCINAGMAMVFHKPVRKEDIRQCLLAVAPSLLTPFQLTVPPGYCAE
eukprot:NODE_77_length_2740_cov_75.143441_g49_i0.p1 GENE.NODE_77_length_2740_cov_75.143441_g49_i0~~NODE_77_length_2740_cov_75.143441_g49_i0.p1  ORF type:complete len:839 (+),score=213.62 NODE_77_length_2740_cov_75.143441_g49_i0:60-2576(+)